MTTANELILMSMRLIGVVATGETPTANEENTALDALNLLLDAWRLENLMLYRIQELSLALTPSTATYTVGEGGALNTTRPLDIVSAFVRQSNVDYNVTVDSKQRWDSLTQPSTTGTLVTEVYYDPAYPLGTLNVYPVPTNTQYLYLSVRQPLTQITNPNTAIALPTGYMRALKYALALEIAPEFGVTVPTEIAILAAVAKANIKRKNVQRNVVAYDATLLTSVRSHILTGD